MAFYGPFTKLSPNTQQVYRKINWYRQKAPYVERLPMDLVYARSVKLANPIWNEAGTSWFSANSWSFDPLVSPSYNEAYAKAYGKFRDSVRGHVGTAANIAERSSTIDTMVKRLNQILTFSLRLRKGDFLGAGKALGLNLKQRRNSKKKISYRYDHKDRNGGLTTSDMTLKKGLKNFGNNYLEYHFGWEPLVKDIYEAISLIESPIRLPVHRGRATVTREVRPGYGAYGIATDQDIKTSVQVIADVSVTNQAQLTLNQAGVINPLEVLWEVIPFSFIVDWFSNVSDVIGSLTDFLGLSLVHPATTVKTTWVESIFYYTDSGQPRKFRKVYYGRRTTIAVKRIQGIATPVLTLKGLKLPSLTRGLTVISLLTILLKEK